MAYQSFDGEKADSKSAEKLIRIRLPDSLALALSVAQQALRLDSVCYFFSGSEVAIAFGKMPGIGARFFSSRSGVGSGFRGSI